MRWSLVLLPDAPPSVEGADFAAMSVPARHIGGDYNDFVELDDGRSGIALADVSGKGAAAALIMSVVQASLRIISSEGDVPLPRLVARMNAEMKGWIRDAEQYDDLTFIVMKVR